MKEIDRPSDRDLELRIIHSAADLVCGGHAGVTVGCVEHLQRLIAELAQRYPAGYPTGRTPREIIRWPAAFVPAAPSTSRCIPGRPETWPDLEALAGPRSLPFLVRLDNPTATHGPFVWVERVETAR